MIPRLFGSPWHFQATPTIYSSVRLLQPLRYSVVVDDVVVVLAWKPKADNVAKAKVRS